MFKKTLMATLIVLSFSAVAAEKAVNDYDCTIDELKSYMGKKTESLVQRDTAIATFEDFKKGNVAKTSAATAGNAAEGSTTGETEECNYFWGDLEDISYEKQDDSGLLGAILSGDIGSIVNASKERITQIAEGMTEEIKKGVCKRLSTENVKKTVVDYSKGVVKDTTGYSGSITDPDINKVINEGLSGGFGSSGKLLNVFDTKQDSRRSSAVLKETDRQINEMMKFD